MPSTLQDENSDPRHNIAGFLGDFSKALVTSDSGLQNLSPNSRSVQTRPEATPGNSRRTAGRLPFFPRNVGTLNTGTVWFSGIRSGALDSVVRNQDAQISKRKEVKEHETSKPAIADA
jgi:hypothetical protein